MVYPKISIITPSYNQGQYIEATIQSVINQNYPNLEYIIIDGGSNDSTVSIIRKYENNIYYWVSEHDKGQTHAINKGLIKCTGDIIGWINSDDIYQPNTFIQIATTFLKLNGGAHIISGNFISINQESKILWEPTEIDNRFYEVKYTYLNLLQCWKHTLPQPSTFWNREVFNKIGLLDENFNFAMDLEYWLRAIKNNVKIYRVNQIYSKFRTHENSKSSLIINILQKDLYNLQKIYLQNKIVFIRYSASKYIWYNSTLKINEGIKCLINKNRKRSVYLIISSIIYFPFNIILANRKYIYYIKYIIFKK